MTEAERQDGASYQAGDVVRFSKNIRGRIPKR